MSNKYYSYKNFPERTVTCESPYCDKVITTRSKLQRFCSTLCRARTASYRRKLAEGKVVEAEVEVMKPRLYLPKEWRS